MDSITQLSAIEEQDTHSAIPTWSGFNYQGQVSIYWVIKLLNEKDLSKVQLEDYELVIESLEDFSINYKGSPISIHQVKAYQSQATFSKYKRAIHDLLGKCAKYPCITSCYLHTCYKFELPNNNKLKEDLEAIKSKKNKKQFSEYKNLLFFEEGFNQSIEKLFINKEDESEHKCVIKRLEIEEEIKYQIKLFLKNNKDLCDYNYVDSQENINFIYLNFIYEINLLVAQGHEDKNKNTLFFSKFVQVLTKNYIFSHTKTTASSMLKNVLSNYFIEYCDKYDIEPEECMAWKKNWEWICRLNDDDFLLLCKKLSPTINVDTSKLETNDLRELIVKAGAHKTLFPMVINAESFGIEIKGVKEMFILNKEGIHHLVTTIAETWGKNEAEKQGAKIFETLKNDNQLVPMLYEVHTIITNELEGLFEGTITDIGRDYENVISGYEEKEKIVRRKKMNFINVENAMEVFKL